MFEIRLVGKEDAVMKIRGCSRLDIILCLKIHAFNAAFQFVEEIIVANFCTEDHVEVVIWE